ncbi:hypothetical protein N9885_01460 [Flavobacteriaceae bacterium]|jgi:hypothetical protein|nr:hypothetical protein [Flavobacteriaceae bacterium]
MNLKLILFILSFWSITKGLFLYFFGQIIVKEFNVGTPIMVLEASVSALKPFGAYKIGVGLFILIFRNEEEIILKKVCVGIAISVGILLVHISINYFFFDIKPPVFLLALNFSCVILGVYGFFKKSHIIVK